MPRTRGSGSVYRQKQSAFWWIKYYRNGKAHYESAKTTDRKQAEGLLRKRLGEIATGTFAGPETERVRVAELAEDLLRDYRINGKRSLDDVEARWKLHLQPFLGDLRAVQVTSGLLNRYVDERQQQGAKNATINREMAALKRMFYLGYRSTPPRVLRVPAFPHLTENNARKGFLEDGQYRKLVESCSELWFRALVEVGRTYGWRIGELLQLRVRQIDVLSRTLRLEPGTTKNRDGREVTMTETVYRLLIQCVAEKRADDYVFTRENGNPVRDFRKTWGNACCSAGLGKFTCSACQKDFATALKRCPECKSRVRYVGLLVHDLRRTAARELRRAGVAEGVIMKIGGWRTRSVFERYAIVAQSDIQDAMRKLEAQRNGDTHGDTDPQAERKPEERVRPN